MREKDKLMILKVNKIPLTLMLKQRNFKFNIHKFHYILDNVSNIHLLEQDMISLQQSLLNL